MTYIKLEDVRKIYNRNRYCQKISEGYTETYPNIVVDVIKINAIEEIETLPSINPEAMIEEMIEEINQGGVSYIEQPITILKEAKSRIQKQS